MKANLLVLLMLISFSISFGGECRRIILSLVPEKPRDIKLNAYAGIRKDLDIGGKEQGQVLTEPKAYIGLRFTMPIIDRAEEYRRKIQRYKDLSTAQRTLSQYLELRQEVEDGQKILEWKYKRVKAGVEYLKNVLPEEKELNIKKQRLKTLEEYLTMFVSKEQLDRCYKEGLKK